jgi:hypothetical protein
MPQITTHTPPILGKNGNYPAWIQIPNISRHQDTYTQRFLSVSIHSAIEVKLDDKEQCLHLVFPISRYVEVIKTEDNVNRKCWIISYNDKDLKRDSEDLETNSDEGLR